MIQRGKGPNRQELANYLRTNFTVDFEKERARLEAYKEITADDSEDDGHRWSTTRAWR